MGTRVALLPNGSSPVTNNGFSVYGSATLVTALTDVDDTTYVKKTATTTSSILYNLATSTLGSAIPWRVRALAKCDVPTSGGLLALNVTGDGVSTTLASRQTSLTNTAVRTTTNRARSAGVATLYFSSDPGLIAGQQIYVTAVGTAYNGLWTVKANSSGGPSEWTVTYDITDTSTEAKTADADGKVEVLNGVGAWYPLRYLFPSSFTDQAAVDALRTGFTDSGSSSTSGRSAPVPKPSTIYKALLELETTTSPTATSLTVEGMGGSVAVTTASQSGTSITVNVASHNFAVNDTVYLLNSTSVNVGTNKGVVTATTATSVTFTVSASATVSPAVAQTNCVLMPRMTTTTTPTVGWVYGQSDSIPQYTRQLNVFTAAQADPSVTAGAHFVNSASGTGTFRRIDTPLANSTTYWAYVRVGMRAVTDGYAGTDINTTYYSSWALTQIRVDVTPPTAPTLTSVSWNTANQRVGGTVNISSFGSGGDDSQVIYLERSDDGGTTWASVRGFPLDKAFSITATSWEDYEAPRGVTVRYRAYSVGTLNTGEVLTSAYSSESPVATVNDGKHWLKDPLDSTRNMGDVQILADATFDVEEQAQVLRPLGRSDAVVVSGAIGGDDGTFTIYAGSEALWTSLSTLLLSQRTLLWQDAFGKQAYIRVLNRSYQRVGTLASPKYMFTASYVEVGAP